MRITRLPPEQRPRTPRKLAASETFKGSDTVASKSVKSIRADYGHCGVLRQNPGVSRIAEHPTETRPPQNRQETALESGANPGCPDVAPGARSGNFKGPLKGFRRSSPRDLGEGGAV